MESKNLNYSKQVLLSLYVMTAKLYEKMISFRIKFPGAVAAPSEEHLRCHRELVRLTQSISRFTALFPGDSVMAGLGTIDVSNRMDVFQDILLNRVRDALESLRRRATANRGSSLDLLPGGKESE